MIGRLPHKGILRFRSKSGTDRFGNEILGRRDEIPVAARFEPAAVETAEADRDLSRTLYDVEFRCTGEDAARTAADLATYDEIEWVDEGLVILLDGAAEPLHDGLGRRHHFEAKGHVRAPA